MEPKNTTVESSINGTEYREREETRVFIEEYRRARAKRVVFETTVGTYYRTPRQAMPASWRPPFLRRDQNNKEEAKKNTASRPRKTEKSRFSSLCYRHVFPDK